MKIALCLLCCLFFTSSYAQQLAIDGQEITTEKPYVELFFEGDPPKKGYKTSLTFINTAAQLLDIKAVEGSCDCIKVFLKKKQLKQDQQTTLVIHWNPSGDTEFSGAVSIQSNDPTYPELWIHLIGNLN